jgi:hypothetical protein
MWRQGGGADFRKGHFELIYTKRCLQNIGSWTSPNHMFSIYWMIGVWGSSPPGDCAILEARWLHFLRFLKQIRKRIALTFLTIRYFAKAILSLNWEGTFAPLAPPGKGQRGRLPLLPPPPVPASLVSLVASWHVCVVHETWKSQVCRCCTRSGISLFE